MPAGRYLRSALLGWLSGDAMPTAPTSVWLHICTSAPSAAAVGTAPTIAGYAPLEIDPADWDTITTGADSDRLPNAVELAFGPFDDGEATEVATHAMLMDGSNPASANLLHYGALGASRSMVANGTLVLAAGDVGLTA